MLKSANPVLRRIPAAAIAVILAAGMILFATGCSGKETGPSIAVSAYMETVKTMDPLAGNAYLTIPTVEGDYFLAGRKSELPTDDATYQQLFTETISRIYSEMTYKVKSTAITGETAVVAVEVTIADMSELEDMMASVAFNGSGSSPEVQNRMITEVLVEELQLAADSTKIMHTVRLDLKLVDNAWKILDHKALGRALIGNISGLLIPEK